MKEIRRCNKNNHTDDRVAESRSYCYSKDCIAHSSPGAINKSSELECKATLKNEFSVSEGREEDDAWAVGTSGSIFSYLTFQQHYRLPQLPVPSACPSPPPVWMDVQLHLILTLNHMTV